MDDVAEKIELVEPSERLLRQVLLRVRDEHQLPVAQRRFIIISILFLSSVFGLVSVGMSLSQAVSESGFTKILSLVFSDSTLVFSAWQDFGYSLLEALPAVLLLLASTIALIFFATLQYILREFKYVFGSRSFASQ